MKKKIFALAIILLCFLLVSCTKETTSLHAKKSHFFLALNGSVNMEDYVERDGNGQLNYSVENPEVLEIDGSILRGKAVGKGAVIVESDGFIVRIEVEVIDTRKVSVNVLDGKIEYDGNEHLPTVVGKLPEGSSVRFFLGEEPFSGARDAGRYELTAEVSVPAPYYVEYQKKECVYIVEPKQFDLSGVYFTSSVYTYDGEEKSILLSGDLPEGLNVRYENNVGTEAGIYRAEAIFIVPDEKNYYPISPMRADLVIRQKFVNIEKLGFSSSDYLYDGKEHAVRFNEKLDGMEVEYYTYDNKTKVPLAGNYTFKDSGEYPIYASITLTPFLYRNYSFYADGLMTFSSEGGLFVSDADTDALAVLTVRKRSFYYDYRWSLTDPSGKSVLSVPYGKEISLGEEGAYTLRLMGKSYGLEGEEFTQGASIRYSASSLVKNSYGNVNSGTYTVTATFEMPAGSEKNYNPIPEQYYSLMIAKGVIDVSDLVFTADPASVEYDGTTYEFSVDSSAMDGFDQILKVDYVRKKNGLTMLASEAIAAPAEYDITAVFTLIGNDKDNYAVPNSMTVHFVIHKKVVIFDGSFESVDAVYDGTAHAIEVSGNLPEDLSVVYSCGVDKDVAAVAYTDAGTYRVTAAFRYKNWLADKFVLKDASGKEYPILMTDAGKEFYGLTAVLFIDKKKITLTNEIKNRYEQASIPVYSEELTAGDIEISGNDQGYVRCEAAEKKIALTGYNADAHTAYFTLSLIYNVDVKNHYDVPFTITGYVHQKEIDLSGVTVPNQFVAYTGQTVVPVIKGAEAQDLLIAAVTATDGTDLISVGKHSCRIVLELKQEKRPGYYLSGTSAYPNVDLYVYNAAQYSYAPGTTSMTAYKGSDRTVSVPEGTTGIQKDAFAAAERVEKLTLPDSLTVLADGSLFGTLSLTELSLPSYYSLNRIFKNSVPTSLIYVSVRNCSSIPERAFDGQMYLQKITIGSSVSEVGSYAFYGCSSLTKVVIPNVPTYGQNVFSGCVSLESLTVKDFVSASWYFGAGGNKGYSSYAISSITVTESLTVGEEAFKGLSSLASISLPDGVTSIGKRAFSGVRATIDLSRAAFTTAEQYAFAGFEGVLSLPGGMTTISPFAFSECLAERLVFSKSLQSISADAFSGCRSTLVFASDSTFTAIGTGAFRGYAGSALSLPSSVTSLGIKALESSAVVSFEIPVGMKIGTECFKNCKNLSTVTVRCVNIPDGAFSGCTALKEVIFGDGTETIGDNAFYGCSVLTTITLPLALTAIGTTAFSGCELSTVTMTAEEPPALIKSGVFPTDRAIRFDVPEVRYSAYVDYIRGVGCDMTKCTVNGRSPG